MSILKVFKNQLSQICSSLTEKELMLCCYIKLGLKTKTISILKEVDQNSITMAKYRIKKKLHQAENLTLEQYIKSM